MKIAFIVGEFPSLSETFILNQITGLIDLGADIEIFALDGNFDNKIQIDITKYNLKNRIHYINIPHNRINRLLLAIVLIINNFYKYPLIILKSLNFFLGKEALSLYLFYYSQRLLNYNFDVIYCHFGPIGNICAYLKRIGIKGKLITVFYGADIKLHASKGRELYKNLFKIGDAFIAISKYHRKTLISMDADPKKVIYHPVGIDIEKFSVKRQINSKKKHKIIITTIARLVEEKGLEYGIKAVNKLIADNPEINVKYNIIGDGPLKNRLTGLIKKLNLVNIVRLLGPMTREEIIQELDKSYVFFLPSISETFGVVLLEAQAMYLPVLATRIGGVPETMLENKSGFLVPARNYKTMAKKLKYLIDKPRNRFKMGIKGRIFVENNFNINKLNSRLKTIFQNIINGNS